MLRPTPYGLIIVLLISFCGLSIADESNGAISSLKRFAASEHLEKGEAILGLVGFYGDPAPPQWLILTTVEEKPGILREAVFARGNVVAQRKFKVLPGQDLPHIPVQIEALRIDSAKAFIVAERAAVEKKAAFDSVHYQLRCREAGQEPVWMLSLINSSQVAVGVVYISAVSGEVIRESWPLLQKEKFASPRSES